METIRYAVIGTGGIAGDHLRGIAGRPGVEVVGLCDSWPDALTRTASRYPKAVADVDARRMLKAAKPNVVSICTPNKWHHEYTMAALAAGAHVVCEKPMAMGLAEAEEMEGARAAAGRIGLINFTYRNVPAFRFARELVQSRELGRLLRFHAVYLQSHLGGEGTRFSWRNSRELAGFGAMGDLGVHMIDAARFIMGTEFERVFGQVQTLVPAKPDWDCQLKPVTTDTNGAFLAEFENEVLGTFETSQVLPGYGNHFRVEISGTRGTVIVSAEDERNVRLVCGDALSRHVTWTTSLPLVAVPTGFIDCQRAATPGLIVDLIRGAGDFEYPSFKDGVAVQRVLAALGESAHSGRWAGI